jgi:hypothetical protein
MTAPNIRELCEQATPGPWLVKGTGTGHKYENNWREISPNVVSSSMYSTNRWGEREDICGVRIKEADAQLIARLDPQTVLKIVDALEAIATHKYNNESHQSMREIATETLQLLNTPPNGKE